MKEYNERIARKRGQKAAGLAQQLKDHVRIYFPSDQTVTRSRGGRGVSRRNHTLTGSLDMLRARGCLDTPLLPHHPNLFTPPPPPPPVSPPPHPPPLPSPTPPLLATPPAPVYTCAQSARQPA